MNLSSTTGASQTAPAKAVRQMGQFDYSRMDGHMKHIDRNLTQEETKDFRKRVKIQLLKNDLTIEDMEVKTGYSARSLKNAMTPTGTFSKFMVSALATALDINLSTYTTKGDEENAKNEANHLVRQM